MAQVAVSGIPYYTVSEDAGNGGKAEKDDCRNERCRLDIWLPSTGTAGATDGSAATNGGKMPFATIVWFHGGGLTGGERYLPESLRRVAVERRVVVVAVGYRLAPQAQFPEYIEDAAAAAAWVKRHIAEYGGDPDRIFLCGGSAGAYLAAMVIMDPRWLDPYGLHADDFAGLIPVSGQMTTHFLVKQQLGIPGNSYLPVIDKNAPLGHLSMRLPPILLVLGDRRREWKARVEENEFMASSLRAIGFDEVTLREHAGFDHGISGLGDDCTPQVTPEIVDFVLETRPARQRDGQ